MQAAVLRVKLRQLEPWLTRRRELAALYDAGLQHHRRDAARKTRPIARPTTTSTRSACVRRDALRAALAAEGIESAVHYPLACFQQPVYAGLYPPDGWPLAAAAAAEVLSLPLYPELDPEGVTRVVAAIERFQRSAESR